MKLLTNIKKYFWQIIIIILSIIILLQKCSNDSNVVSQTVTTTDTLWLYKTDTFTKKVVVYKTKLKIPSSKEFQLSSNIDTCNKRLKNLINDYALIRIYKDSIPLSIDGLDLGGIIIKDTVYLNKLQNREVFRNIKISQITKTITITKEAEVKRQLYFGGSILGNAKGNLSVGPGLLYKDRKDRIFTVNASVDNIGNIIYGGGTYWKINLNKKK